MVLDFVFLIQGFCTCSSCFLFRFSYCDLAIHQQRKQLIAGFGER